MKIEFQRLRAADHMRNLYDLSRAAREMATREAMTVADFRTLAAALVAGTAPKAPGSPRKSGVSRKTRQ